MSECHECRESAQDIFEANMENYPFAGEFQALYDELRRDCEHDAL